MGIERINVTKTYLPPLDQFMPYLEEIWESGWVTNHGKMVLSLESELKSYLQAENLYLVTNGTLALQIAIRVLELENKDVITTPFSYVATINSLLWEKSNPILVDIDPKTLNIDINKIKDHITDNTKAILAVHVYGYPAPLIEISKIAKEYNLKIIYDAAHAFGTTFEGNHLSFFGDITCYSFHATKPYHCIEGGALVVKNPEVGDKINWMRRFGHLNDEYFGLGINAKLSELHAAMGLLNLKAFDHLISLRRRIWELYDQKLYIKNKFKANFEKIHYNYAYYPFLFEDEKSCMQKLDLLHQENIYPRRYFYPGLNNLPHFKALALINSDRISKSVLCLPLFEELDPKIQNRICDLVLT